VVTPIQSGGYELLAYGLRGNLFSSMDQGDTWEKLDSGTSVTLMSGLGLPDGSVLLANQGGGLLVRAEKPIEFSALHYSADDLHRAHHLNELDRRREVVLNLDYHQRGLGGASCGPDTLPRYRIGPGLYSLRFTLLPLPSSGR
jgi:hypothetical protein